MNNMKRVIALLLCVVLLTGVLPVGAFAAEPETTAPSVVETVATEATDAAEETTEAAPTETLEPVRAEAEEEAVVFNLGNIFSTATTDDSYLDAAIFCSDLHGSTSELEDVLDEIVGNLDASAIGFVGDTCLKEADVNSLVKENLVDEDIAVVFSYAAGHDTENGSDLKTNWAKSKQAFKNENFIVYTIQETDMESASSTAPAAFTSWYNDLSAADKTLPIFIISHKPLHNRRGDNKGAAVWYNAISAAAESSDIVFLWAHNHTGESSVDTNAYYVAKDGSETVSIQNGSTVTPNFTYMNAGYINANGQSPKRKPVATTVKITEDKLIFQDYTTDGTYTNSSYSHNVTVDREFAAEVVSLSSISVTAPTKLTYFVGEELDTTGMVITAHYSDGSTETVTADYDLTGYDMSVAGTQTVTVIYEGKTATFQITVQEIPVEPTVNTVECWDDTEQVIVQATGLGLTAVEAFNVTGDNEKCDEVFTSYGYVAFDIVLSDLVEGESVAYSISMVPDLDTTNLELYYIDGNGDLTPVEFELTTDDLGNAYVEFTTDKVGTFVYGSPAVPEGYVLSSMVMTAGIPDEVLLGASLVLGDDAEITATYTKAGAEDFVRKLTVWDYDYTNFSGFDVNVPGNQTVTFTFEGMTVTHDIYVWGSDFEDAGVSVELDKNGSEFGVIAATVAESTNPNIANAVANVLLEGYVAYDISLVYAEGYAATGDTKTVTLPMPEGVVNPAVYYVSDSGKSVVDMEAVASEDGKSVIFTTTHFTDYVVGEGITITVPDNETADGDKTTTTTTTKTIYKLVSTPTAGKEYLIVSRNSAGSGYGLAGSTTGQSVTVKAADSTSSAVYIENKGDALEWTASSGWSFASGSYNLGYNYGLDFDEDDDWTFSNNQLYQSTRSWNGNVTYYLRCSSGTWSASTTQSNVYFYEKQEVKVETPSTVSGTYSIDGEDLTVVAIENATVDLTSLLAFSGDSSTQDVSADATYAVYKTDSVNGDPLGVIKSLSGNVVTLSGKTGKALIKVSYDTNGAATGGVVTDYITVTATTPHHYGVQLHKAELTVAETYESGKTYYTYNKTTYTYQEEVGLTAFEEGKTYYTTPVVQGEEITKPVVLKDIEAGDTYSVWAVVKAYAEEGNANGVDLGELGSSLRWKVDDEDIASINTATGLITFTGKKYGTVHVTVDYERNGKTVTDTIAISVTDTTYIVPSDGMPAEFPEYPNEGAVRFDKTATAVGNFSQTGIAKVELSMTGVPYATGNELDVVIMLDMTGSMSDKAMVAAEEAAIAFAESIVKNEDGTYNKNRISVMAFNSGSSSPYTYWELGTVTAAQWDTFCSKVRGASSNQTSGGTPYDEALEKCRDVLNTAKTDGTGNNRQQFCVFMSDGGPTSFKYITNYDAVKNGTATQYTTASATATGGANQKDSNFATIAGYTHEYYSTLMKDDGVTVYSVLTGLVAANYPNCTAIMRNIATDSDKAYVVESGDDTSAVTNALTNIGVQIKQAATDVKVEDKIGNNYGVNFSIPGVGTDLETNITNALGNTTEFYIQVLEYQLDENKQRTDTYEVLEKFTFDSKTGTLKSHTVKGVSCSGCTHVTATNGTITMINGTYFDYENKTDGEYLIWEADKLTTTELVLEYFVHLNNSSEKVGKEGEIKAGTYITNEYANLTYTNVNGNRVQQKFPIPQMTWNGAQVSYTFYLVNEQGQPVNRAGRVVPFAEAVYVTDVFTKNVVWNDEEQITSLDAEYEAKSLLPDVYELYDVGAGYNIHVFEDEKDSNLNNHFVIEAGMANYTTYVYNTKADRMKYNAPGTYAETETYMCKVYTEDGEFEDELGRYNKVQMTDGKVVATGFDFANTTVAFAVVFKPGLTEDTVVLDYGLDVIVNVKENDVDGASSVLSADVVGVRTDAPNAKINGGAYNNPTKLQSVTVSDVGTASMVVENGVCDNVRFSLNRENSMQFKDPVSFYYESAVEYYDGNGSQSTAYMYSMVTVIPATTVYYEDDFLELSSYTDDGGWKKDTVSRWEVENNADAVQNTDRPGESNIGGIFDADNVYGYDSAYDSCTTNSLGGYAKIDVTAKTRGEAVFTFYGTGFDVISLTSNGTGTMTYQIYAGSSVTDTAVASGVVDTYYGYIKNNEGEWVQSNNNPNALYQVPVLKHSGLEYGQYTVKICAVYGDFFNHTGTQGKYTLYLDAIRIYDPTGNRNATANEAYVADKEGWPVYHELRNLLIKASNYNVDENGNVTGADLPGAIFIDSADSTNSISDYVNYGPNNEVYLAKGQAIAYTLKLPANIADVQIGIKSVGTNAAKLDLYRDLNSAGDITDKSTALIEYSDSATDRYYSIGSYVIRENGNDSSIKLMFHNSSDNANAIISITNIKFTFKSDPGAGATAAMIRVDEELGTWALKTLRASAQKEEIPEPTVPEETEPEVTEPEVTEPEETLDANLQVSIREKSVKVGSTVVVKATTSSDVEALIVNGKQITHYTENRRTGVRTWTINVKAEEAGDLEILVTAYSAKGQVLETALEQITVIGKKANVVEQIVGTIIGVLLR